LVHLMAGKGAACFGLQLGNIAKSLGVAMRIDVVRQATQALTDTAKTERVSRDQFRMGVYTLGTKAEDAKLTTISSPTS
ncbi:hypothetical protein ACC760_39625, partial [Rhizobium ruizarguesonis]